MEIKDNNHEYKVDTSSPVLVTGGTGYMAGSLIQELLELGVTVHTTVRDVKLQGRYDHLLALAESSPGTLKVFDGDLLEPGSFARAMENCSIVFHMASPYYLDATDPESELIQPAVNGTKNVLEQACKTSTVTRVVFTSCCAAIFTDANEAKKILPDQVFTESQWNNTATIAHQPYHLSKTLAEKEAWEIAGSQTQWKLVVLNPSGTFGPGVKYRASSESYNIMQMLTGGEMIKGCPNFWLGVVDVRDVAHAHVLAAYTPNAKGRHILCAANTCLWNIANVLRENYPNYPLPKRKLPKFLLWMIAPYLPSDMPISRKMIRGNVDVPTRLDNTKSRKELGMIYRPVSETILEMFKQMIDEGVVCEMPEEENLEKQLPAPPRQAPPPPPQQAPPPPPQEEQQEEKPKEEEEPKPESAPPKEETKKVESAEEEYSELPRIAIQEKPDEPVGMVQPDEPVGIVQPEEPMGMVQPEEPMGMVQPEEPVGMVQPEEPVVIVQPEEPMGIVQAQA